MAKVWQTYQDYLNSPEWDELSTLAKARDGYRCRVCNSREGLHAHHRLYRRWWVETQLEDLTTLCDACHTHFHTGMRISSALFSWIVILAGVFGAGWLFCASF